MGGQEVTPRSIFQDSNGAIRQTVAQDPMAIGYISLGLVDDSVKPLAISGVAPPWKTAGQANTCWSARLSWCFNTMLDRSPGLPGFCHRVAQPGNPFRRRLDYRRGGGSKVSHSGMSAGLELCWRLWPWFP